MTKDYHYLGWGDKLPKVLQDFGKDYAFSPEGPFSLSRRHIHFDLIDGMILIHYFLERLELALRHLQRLQARFSDRDEKFRQIIAFTNRFYNFIRSF